MVQYNLSVERRKGEFYSGNLLINGTVVGRYKYSRHGLRIRLSEKLQLWNLNCLLTHLEHFDDCFKNAEISID